MMREKRDERGTREKGEGRGTCGVAVGRCLVTAGMFLVLSVKWLRGWTAQ